MRATTLVSGIALLSLAACGPSDSKSSQTKTEPPTATEQAVTESSQELTQATGQNVQITAGEMAAGTQADKVADAKTKFATAAVKSRAGEAVGEVRSVTVGSDGKASAIVVEVGGFLNSGERLVSLNASRFTYLPDRNILVTAASKEEIEKLPPAVILN